ncbi:MAG: hypothetical protein HC840_01975 [Leptolyngbyaceae cyanobacterium RM2_2_4]|nr:hypothetical protein [Leptolyngbyaceae cyanobacterium SM1_4_3]NJO48443.1 hypothetical protein [Leptolyngbyaceae cyanobacterium RM2_2_4]
MQAYKLKGTINASGQLIITEPIEIPAGEVEVIILQPSKVLTEQVPTSDAPKKREYKVQALRDLLENAPPTPPDFDPDQAKWEYLKEKHNL